jgi:hypothetical protein
MSERKLFFTTDLFFLVTEGYLTIASAKESQKITLSLFEINRFVRQYTSEYRKSAFRIAIGPAECKVFLTNNSLTFGEIQHTLSALQLNLFDSFLQICLPQTLCGGDNFRGVAFIGSFVSFLGKKTEQEASSLMQLLMEGEVSSDIFEAYPSFKKNQEDLKRYLYFYREVVRSCFLLNSLHRRPPPATAKQVSHIF